MGHSGELSQFKAFVGYAFGLVLIALALLVAPESVSAETPEIQFELLPTSVVLVPDKPASVLAVVRNPGTTDLTDIKLSWFSNSGEVKVCVNADTECVGEDTLLVLPAGGAYSWNINVRGPAPYLGGDAPRSAAIHFKVDYSEGAPVIHKIQTASLDATLRPPRLEDTATIELITPITSMNEFSSGEVYVIVKNHSDDAIWVEDAAMHTPGFVVANPPSQHGQISPGSAMAFSFHVEATSGKLKSGKQTMLATAKLLRPRDDQTAYLVASKDFDASPFGESAILSALQLPSFFLVPGPITMATIAYVLRAKPPTENKEPIFEIKEPIFWVFSIAISLAMAFLIYPFGTWALSNLPVTKHLVYFRTTREYLTGYTLWDIALSWAFSLVLAALIWFAVELIRRIGRKGAAATGSPASQTQ